MERNTRLQGAIDNQYLSSEATMGQNPEYSNMKSYSVETSSISSPALLK
jgi:hypothetical protein